MASRRPEKMTETTIAVQNCSDAADVEVLSKGTERLFREAPMRSMSE